MPESESHSFDLPEDQSSRLAIYKQWSVQTGPCHRQAAAVAACQAYQAIDRPAPQVLWFDSPTEPLRLQCVLVLLAELVEVCPQDKDGRPALNPDWISRRVEEDWQVAYFDRGIEQLIDEEFIAAAVPTERPKDFVISAFFGYQAERDDPEDVLYVRDVVEPLVGNLKDQLEDGRYPGSLEEDCRKLIDAIGQSDKELASHLTLIARVLPDLSRDVLNHLLKRAAKTVYPWDLDSGRIRSPEDSIALIALETSFQVPRQPAFNALVKTVRECGLWWPTRHICFIAERPLELHFDDNGNLHNENGMCVRFKDGWGIYHLHGLPVSRDVALGHFSAEDILKEQNIELRRVMIERYGAIRFLDDSGAEEVQRDSFGVLYKKKIPHDEDIVAVKVINSTEEPGGRRREYFLRVPPFIQTAHQAVAWSFGLDEESYEPEIET